jgi:hypothetical protein
MSSGQTTAGERRAATRRLRRRYAIAIHSLAAIAVLATALRGRLPFVPMYDTSGVNRPSWLGLVTVWVLVTAAYLVVWRLVSRAGRLSEVLLFISMMVATLWAGWTVLVTALQAVGLGTKGLRFTLTWWLQVFTALAVLGALMLILRARQAGDEDDDDPDDEDSAIGRHDAIPLPAPMPKFAAGAAGVAVVGLLAGAYGLALLAPPTATPDSARRAVEAATDDVPADGLLGFQAGLAKAVDRQARISPRDRWGVVEGLVESDQPPPYNKDLYWGTQVRYREQLTCVAAHSVEKRIVVLAGVCPR